MNKQQFSILIIKKIEPLLSLVSIAVMNDDLHNFNKEQAHTYLEDLEQTFMKGSKANYVSNGVFLTTTFKSLNNLLEQSTITSLKIMFFIVSDIEKHYINALQTPEEPIQKTRRITIFPREELLKQYDNVKVWKRIYKYVKEKLPKDEEFSADQLGTLINNYYIEHMRRNPLKLKTQVNYANFYIRYMREETQEIESVVTDTYAYKSNMKVHKFKDVKPEKPTTWKDKYYLEDLSPQEKYIYDWSAKHSTDIINLTVIEQQKEHINGQYFPKEDLIPAMSNLKQKAIVKDIGNYKYILYRHKLVEESNGENKSQLESHK